MGGLIFTPGDVIRWGQIKRWTTCEQHGRRAWLSQHTGNTQNGETLGLIYPIQCSNAQACLAELFPRVQWGTWKQCCGHPFSSVSQTGGRQLQKILVILKHSKHQEQEHFHAGAPESETHHYSTLITPSWLYSNKSLLINQHYKLIMLQTPVPHLVLFHFLVLFEIYHLWAPKRQDLICHQAGAFSFATQENWARFRDFRQRSTCSCFWRFGREMPASRSHCFAANVNLTDRLGRVGRGRGENKHP